MQTRFLSCRPWMIGWLLAGACFLSSCQLPIPPASHLNQRVIGLEDLRKRLVFKQSGIADLKSFVRATVEIGGRKQSFRQALNARESDSLRIDVLNPLGQPLGVYIYNGRNIKGQRSVMYDSVRNRIFLGQEVRESFAKTLGMDINLADYISVFYGNIPRLQFLKMTGGTLEGGEDAVYSLTGVDPADKSWMEIEIDAYSLVPNQMTHTSKSGETLHVKWRDYRAINGRDFPHRIVLELPSEGRSLTFVYTNPIINGGISDDSFRLSPSGNRRSRN